MNYRHAFHAGNHADVLKHIVQLALIDSFKRKDSPFFGLPIPPEVTVKAQVLAEPDPDLAARTIAALADGTPLVTRKEVGQGQVVLVHVTANAKKGDKTYVNDIEIVAGDVPATNGTIHVISGVLVPG